MLKSLLVVLLVVLTSSQAVLADVVITRSQERHAGTVANREAFARDPAGTTSVTLVMDAHGRDSVSVQAFHFSEIDSVLLQDGANTRAYDVRTQYRLAALEGILNGPTPRSTRGDHAGTFLTCGLAMAAVGAAFKFGKPTTATVTSTSEIQWTSAAAPVLSLEDRSYNSVNYVLMVVGGGLAGFGMARYAARPAVPAARAGDPETMYLGASVRF